MNSQDRSFAKSGLCNKRFGPGRLGFGQEYFVAMGRKSGAADTEREKAKIVFDGVTRIVLGQQSIDTQAIKNWRPMVAMTDARVGSDQTRHDAVVQPALRMSIERHIVIFVAQAQQKSQRRRHGLGSEIPLKNP